MLHSVIIPHRNRNDDLRHCLWALNESYKACGLGRDDVEVVVVDTRSDKVPSICGGVSRTQLVYDHNTLKTVKITHEHPGKVSTTTTHKVYCKTAALNVGMDAANGELLTFLDADMLVGPRFLHAWLDGEPPEITKLAYRVRRIDDAGMKLLAEKGPGAQAEIRKRWGHFSLATEIYVTPEESDIARGQVKCAPPNEKDPGPADPRRIIGNSQFTIPRANLGDRRWNEDYIGAGSEDLEMLRGIWDDHDGWNGGHQAVLATEADYGILMLPTVDNGQPDWRPPGLGEMNRRRYFGE